MTDLLAPPLRPLETVQIVTPLGIRFWDAARDVAVDSGLVVRARPAAAPTETGNATRTRSGVYAFFGLPRMRAVEYPLTDGPASPPAGGRYIVDVADRERRFVPVAFQVDVPYRGIYPVGLGASPAGDGTPGYFLFSSATRTLSADLAVVRATLVDAATAGPAAHAVVEVRLPGNQRVLGLADAGGQVALAFPYPRFATVISSPPQSTQAAREPPDWPILVRIQYAPAAQVTLLRGLPPDLGSLLAQAGTDIWASASGPPNPELSESLVFGRELVLRTDDGPTLLIG